MRKIFAILLALLLLVGVCSTAIAEEASVELERPAFYMVENVGGIEGSSFYIYEPTEYYNPQPMLTPVIYVYADRPYMDTESAYAAIQEAGLIDIAEKEFGVIIVVNPVGESWSKTDIDVFEAIEQYIFFSGGTLPLTYHNTQYVIGEGSGATFVNNHLTQNCKRIAAVMTFGGEIGTPFALYALPAYIVSGSQEAVDFYLKLNDADLNLPSVRGGGTHHEGQWSIEETDAKTVYTNNVNDVRKVIVSKADAQTLDAELIADCWKTLFRGTTRTCLIRNAWVYGATRYNDVEFTLAKRPLYEEAGMQVIKHGGNPIWENDESSYWFEYVPAAALKAMEEGSDEKFPLILTLHGAGDNPMYEAESNGWAQLAIDHDLLLVSPNSTNTPEQLIQLIDYMKETYPVDESRIYVVGFSAGGRATTNVSYAYPEVFAAAVPMAHPFGPHVTIDATAYDYDIDLPICIFANQFDNETTIFAENRYKYSDAFATVAELNELTAYEGELDISRYPYWGVPFEDVRRILNPTGFAHVVGSQYDENGMPLLHVILTEDLHHTHYPENANVIWAWMQQFSRNPETFEIIYTPAE